MSVAGFISAALGILLFNAFFVAAEFALVKVRGTRVDQLPQEGNRRARIVAHMLGHLDAYLSACQLGITLTSLALGWLGALLLEDHIGPSLDMLGLPGPLLGRAVAFVLLFAALAFLHILFGQLIPKSIAVGQPRRWSLRIAWPLRGFYGVMFPLLWTTHAVSIGLLKLFRVEPATDSELALSEEELRMAVDSSHEKGVLDEHERDLLDNVFSFGDHTVHQIMVPRTRMNCLYADRPFEENMETIRRTKHTRYPLVEGDRDHVVGMLHLKDLMFDLADRDGSTPDLKALKRELLAVPDTMSISDLLATFQARHVHMAIAIDEYGGTSGIITLEDLIEELVGEIEDEFDADDEPIIEEGPDTWVVDGNVPLKDIAKLTGQTLDDEDVDSVGGLLMLHMNRIPLQGERVRIDELEFEIVRMHAYRVGRVRVRCCPPDDKSSDR